MPLALRNQVLAMDKLIEYIMEIEANVVWFC